MSTPLEDYALLGDLQTAALVGTGTGAVRVLDFMPRGLGPDLVRIVVGISGTCRSS